MHSPASSPSLQVQPCGRAVESPAPSMQHSSTTLPIHNAHVEIIEQPASVGVRFRYKCEGRSAGCIRGSRSSEKSKTFPTIKVHGFGGPAACVVSCVTKEGPPYYPHPHNLVGKHTSGNGVCYRPINMHDMTCSFSNLGIQCVKKKDIKDSLMQRQRLQVDPFGTGFSHYNQPHKINLNTVRLCFQVFVSDSCGKMTIPLPPVISEPIYDNKAVSDLAIAKLSHYCTPVIGGQEIILLCDQVNKDDIEIVFYEEKDGNVVWSSQGYFSPHQVHRKAAICFVSPPYRISCISHPIDVCIQLRRPSDGAVGKPKCFTYLPLFHDPNGMVHKKQKFDSLRLERLLQPLKNEGQVLAPRTIKKAIRNKVKRNRESDVNLENENGHRSQHLSVNAHAFVRTEKDISPNQIAMQWSSKYRSYAMDCSHSVPNDNQNMKPHLCPGREFEDILAVAAQQICEKNSSHEALLNHGEEALERFGNLDISFDPSDLDAKEINFESFLDMSAFNYSVCSVDAKCSSQS